MGKAQGYLEQQLDSLQEPYSIAITAYAISLAEPQSSAAVRAQKKLRDLAICDTSKNILSTLTPETQCFGSSHVKLT